MAMAAKNIDTATAVRYDNVLTNDLMLLSLNINFSKKDFHNDINGSTILDELIDAGVENTYGRRYVLTVQ
jgi:hypothetical protein